VLVVPAGPLSQAALLVLGGGGCSAVCLPHTEALSLVTLQSLLLLLRHNLAAVAHGKQPVQQARVISRIIVAADLVLQQCSLLCFLCWCC
jgi:hypothetical protein